MNILIFTYCWLLKYVAWGLPAVMDMTESMVAGMTTAETNHPYPLDGLSNLILRDEEARQLSIIVGKDCAIRTRLNPIIKNNHLIMEDLSFWQQPLDLEPYDPTRIKEGLVRSAGQIYQKLMMILNDDDDDDDDDDKIGSTIGSLNSPPYNNRNNLEEIDRYFDYLLKISQRFLQKF